MSSHVSGKKAAVLLAGFTLLLASHEYVRLVVEPREAAWSEALTRVDLEAVKRIEIESTGQLHSIRGRIESEDPEAIERVVQAFRSSTPFSPSHPVSRWECSLTIRTAGDSWEVKLVDTDNQGFIAYVVRGARLRNDEGFSDLREMIDTYVSLAAGAAP